MTKDEKLRIARQLSDCGGCDRGRFRGLRRTATRGGQADCRAIGRVDGVLLAQSANDCDIARAAEAPVGAARLAHPHLHRHQRAAHGEEAAHDARIRCSSRRGWRCASRATCGDIEFSPEDGYRSDPISCRVLEAVIAEGRPPSISRHGRLRDPELYGSFIRQLRERAQLRQGDLVGALPQRPGYGRWPTRWPASSSAARARWMHHQRTGRARRQLLARGSGDGGEDAPRLLRPRGRRRRHADRSGLAAGWRRPPASSCSQQGGGGSPAPSRMPRASTGRRARRRDTYEIMRAEDVGRQQDRAGKLSAATPSSSARGTRHRDGSRRRRSTPPSPSSKNSPTKERHLRPRTSSRW